MMSSHVPAAAAPPGATRVVDKFERFERWLRENGAYFPEVSGGADVLR